MIKTKIYAFDVVHPGILLSEVDGSVIRPWLEAKPARVSQSLLSGLDSDTK
jgi:hypothetical protein